MSYKCPDCLILRVKDALFGEDSDKDDPLADSGDRKQLSRSEKSLKAPLKMFQEDYKNNQNLTSEMQLQQFESSNRLQQSSDATRTHTKYPQQESMGLKDESNVMSSSSDDERFGVVEHHNDSTVTDVGIQYIQFIYQDNVKLQQEISEYTDRILRIDQTQIKEREKWEEEIAELERQISLYTE